MERVRGWMLALLLCCAAGAAAEEAQPDARLREAQAAFDEADTLWDAGRYAEATARGEHALTLREAALGDNHPEVARTLDALARRYSDQGMFSRAEPLLARALAIRETVLGKGHPLVAESLVELASIYRSQHFSARAEPLYVRALAIQEAALGKHSLEVARTLGALASLYRDRGLYARASPLYARALALRKAALDRNPADVADALEQIADLYRDQALYARAEPLYERVLALREETLGGSHPLVIESLLALARLYGVQGMYARAEPLFQRVLDLREAAPDKNPLLVADALFALAYLYNDQGLYGRAEPLFERAQALREGALGKNHPKVTESLFAFANLHMAQRAYARAEPLYERVLAIDATALGENHPYVADTRRALAVLYVAQGLYARAEPLLERTLAIMEAVGGRNHPLVAWSLSDLARVYQAQGFYRRARPLLERALAIMEASRPRSRRHGIAFALDNLAGFYEAQGQYGRARSFYERALALQEATLGENHPSVTGTLNRLAVAQLAQHRLSEALPLLARSLALSERRLRREALGVSEARLARFLQSLRTNEERLYALLRAHPEDARVRRLALGAALLLKGRSVEESADISRTVYRGLGEQDRDTFERLRELRTQLAELSLQGPGSLALPAYHQRLEALSEQGAALETDLARRSAPLRELTALPSLARIVDRVATALPSDSALVEFITYVDRPLISAPGVLESQRPGQVRYLALVLFPDATIRFQDLGPSEPMDGAISRLRDALANRDASFLAPAQSLYQLAFQPLLPLLGTTRRLFLSPDGQLALVPFAALHDGQHFLVDAFDFTYVPSGRNLLPRPQENTSPGSVVVIADPDFSAPVPALPTSKEEVPALATRSLPGELFSTLRADLKSRAWAPAPLPGTRQEAEAIQRLLPQAQLFLGADATKQRLLHLPPPAILHLATHGFFLEDAPAPKDSRAVVHFGALGEDSRAPTPPDPLLRSGLVFSGASAPARPVGPAPQAPPPDSALVTALELAGLDLWGTQLVVLSACDTGRGDVKLGQGVYGLRRAFLVAGAETVVMSLWKVNDETTRELMEAYYRNLLTGQGRATALRDAMRELRRTRPHPHDWAPFIAMGSDAPLRLPASGSQDAR